MLLRFYALACSQRFWSCGMSASRFRSGDLGGISHLSQKRRIQTAVTYFGLWGSIPTLMAYDGLGAQDPPVCHEPSSSCLPKISRTHGLCSTSDHGLSMAFLDGAVANRFLCVNPRDFPLFLIFFIRLAMSQYAGFINRVIDE
jgi:hypothetical protein